MCVKKQGNTNTNTNTNTRAENSNYSFKERREKKSSKTFSSQQKLNPLMGGSSFAVLPFTNGTIVN
jgi:hypothetical protein